MVLFGTGAPVTSAPVNVATGVTFISATKALKPVNETMRVGISLGKVTEDKKKEVLSGALKASDIGNIKVSVCKSQSECLPMISSGPYFSNDDYGLGFYASGLQLRNTSFVGVKLEVTQPLTEVSISWSNYSQ